VSSFLPVRSTVPVVPQFHMEKHALWAYGFVCCPGAPGAVTGISDVQGRGNWAGFVACQELLELFVLGEHVLQGLVHYLVGSRMNEGRLLVDGGGERLLDCNGGCDMGELLYFE
jgi:hypothetical protein